MRRSAIVSVFTCAVLFGVLAVGGNNAPSAQGQSLVRGNAPGEWRYWGGDAWSSRYSPLDQINASNFGNLQVAWEWKAGAFGSDEYYRTTPLYANGRLFTVATTRRITAAIDPETGETLWMYRLEEGLRYQKAPRQFAGRGLAYWTDGTSERIITITPGYHLVALDAKTGRPDPKFGKDGVVDLMDGLGLELVPWAVDDPGPLVISDEAPPRRAKPGEGWDPVKKIGADGTIGIDPEKYGLIAASSPAMIVGDVAIVGNSSIHGYYPTRARHVPGYIRGFDVRTGKQLWKFNLIPQKGEFGAETWKNGSAPGTFGVGKNDAWAPYSADPDLGLVYIPVGMPLMDEYGGHRPGDNLFGNSIVALDVKTGKRKWHFQMVHHDIWDYDTPMAPNLMDVTIDGKPRKIIAQPTKQGWLYVFDRETGQPIWPIVETPVPQSEVKGEQTSPTQPIPSKPAPYAHMGLEEDDLIDYTPAIKEAALTLAKKCRMGPYYIPASPGDGTSKLGFECSWYAPGASGGVNIDGGATIDPETGMIYVASQSLLGTIDVEKNPCSEFDYSTPRNSCGAIGAPPPPPGYQPPAAAAGRGAGGGGRGAGGGGRGGGRGGIACADVATARPGTSSCGGVSILKPRELGGITAYDLKTGDKTWWIPVGGKLVPQTSTDPIFAGVTLPPTAPGRQAQVITTKSLVIYGTGRSGAAPGVEPMLYAVDKTTGKEIATVKIPNRTSAVPMTFMHKGKQYIVFATGNGANTSLVALTLPSPTTRQGGGQ
ncbi:MAG TPA: PQQ-binding-like beta-propeller repeat protein [Vicinamibacterales bacterium]|nr:PQQ-binding-like beta-propeller repeat protein [Vicinamibacterales bacterium]